MVTSWHLIKPKKSIFYIGFPFLAFFSTLPGTQSIKVIKVIGLDGIEKLG